MKSLKILISILLAVALFAVPVSAQEDADGDGVVDGDDQCSDTAEGATVDADGCSDAQRSSNSGSDGATTDSDSDGVTDAEDECSDTEAGVEVNSDGCAAYQLDTDRDGVLNEEDDCPDTPHSEKSEVNRQGCTPFMDETLA
ncbi:MAG: thrombospondin type 3 repeat-containing protein, partial [Candidatus Poseidoniales archaeon]|nr:thrombospondin type 3 repeat-containing protein [Candidatus Poseidoniales archaeon]